MEPSIVVSLLSMALTATVAYFGAQRGVSAKLAALDAKVDILSARVEKHNGVTERMAAMEERVRALEHELDEVKKQ